MGYITKNANLVLLFLVVLSITFLVGATVFYESNLARINDRYNEKVDLLKSTEIELNQKLKQLEQSTDALTLKTEREATFTQKYSDVKGERDVLESTKESLEKDKSNLESDLKSKASELQSMQGQMAIKDAEMDRLNVDIARLEIDLDQEEDRARSYKRQLEECEAG